MLKKKVALITGCNRGIGLSIIREFAKNNAIIYAASRTKGSLDDIISDLQEKYQANIIPVYFDLTDSDGIKKTFLKINKEHKKLDVLVNNAGVMKDALIGMVTEENMLHTFQVNVFSVINTIQFAAKLMKRNKSGSIINLASIVGSNGNPGQIVYSASKGAIISLTKTAAKELAVDNIRVNAIAPGMIDTDMLRSIGDSRVDNMISKIGFNRLGEPREVADTAVFLASDASKYISGQVIGVDGCAVI